MAFWTIGQNFTEDSADGKVVGRNTFSSLASEQVEADSSQVAGLETDSSVVFGDGSGEQVS